MANTLKSLAAGGRSFEINNRSKLGQLLKRKGVSKSQQLQRIEGLPRRDPRLSDTEWAERVSGYLKKPEGTMTLRPFQAAALRDIHDFGGAFIQGRVGIGKTLISLLAPVLLGAKRPLLLIPAKLRDKTKREFAALSQHWMTLPLRIESYAKISRLNGDELLQQIAPDLIIADECHKLKSLKSAVTRRVSRWVQNNPETRFVAMSGTVASRSLKDFAHVLSWCVPRGCPLPTRWGDLQEWALAVDEKLPPQALRLASGALEILMNTEELNAPDPVSGARRAVRRRIADTPGVIMSTDRYLGASLTVEPLVPPDKLYVDGIDPLFARLHEEWETPDGRPLADPMQVWRVGTELAWGFFYKWVPDPPREWLIARKGWAAAVRYLLKSNRRGLDSELPIRNAVARGDFDGRFVMRDGMRLFEEPVEELLAGWEAIKDSYEYESVPMWVNMAPVCWLAEQDTDVWWVRHLAVGEQLAKALDVPFFTQGGLDQRTGLHIYDHDGPCVASWRACGEGLNLQKWSRQIIVTPPTSGKDWEQLLGRMHRDGQEADEVSTRVCFGSQEHWGAWVQAQNDARFLQDTTGQEQKLLFADVTVPEDMSGAPPRWRE